MMGKAGRSLAGREPMSLVGVDGHFNHTQLGVAGEEGVDSNR